MKIIYFSIETLVNKVLAKFVFSLMFGTALFFMSPKEINGQAILGGYVGTEASDGYCANAIVEFKDKSDTTKTYVDITTQYGEYLIMDVPTGIDDLLDENNMRVQADGTIATTMQVGDGLRTFYAAVGEPSKEISVFDILGRTVTTLKTEYDVNTGITKASVEPSNWADAVYFIAFKGQENAGAIKFTQLSNNVFTNDTYSGLELLNKTRTTNKQTLQKILDTKTYIVEVTATDSSRSVSENRIENGEKK